MEEDDARPTEAVAALFLADDDTSPEDVLHPGMVVSGYEIVEQIGAGGMGVVYAAVHPVIGKRVAIKVLRRELCARATEVERFVTEARAVNEIGHPNIVDIFDLGTLPDGRQYLVMDLLVGETLRAALDRGPLHVSVAATVIDECASALLAAHATGIVHRDLKPDNVFLVAQTGRHPEARLLDFGIAKLVVAGRADGTLPGGRTRLGAGSHPHGHAKPHSDAGRGTPGYMSPEQARGRGDHRTDIYALGVMMFELLAGRRPYERTSVLDLLIAHAEAPIPSLAKLAPALPVEVPQLVEAMLAKRPDDRPTLAAVRTVIKRLKSTVLPSLTDAYAQIAATPANSPPAEPAPSSTASVTRAERPERLAATTPMRARPKPAIAASPGRTQASAVPPVPRTSEPAIAPPVVDDRDHAWPARPGATWLWFVLAAIGVIAGGLAIGLSI